ncbi:MAG: hypothetical protein WC438_03175 [Candidatus Pacearchaeota archaeon]
MKKQIMVRHKKPDITKLLDKLDFLKQEAMKHNPDLCMYYRTRRQIENAYNSLRKYLVYRLK